MVTAPTSSQPSWAFSCCVCCWWFMACSRWWSSRAVVAGTMTPAVYATPQATRCVAPTVTQCLLDALGGAQLRASRPATSCKPGASSRPELGGRFHIHLKEFHSTCSKGSQNSRLLLLLGGVMVIASTAVSGVCLVMLDFDKDLGATRLHQFGSCCNYGN